MHGPSIPHDMLVLAPGFVYVSDKTQAKVIHKIVGKDTDDIGSYISKKQSELAQEKTQFRIMPPTKTPILSHQTNTSIHPTPRHPNHRESHQAPLRSSASLPNLLSDEISHAKSDLNPENKPVYYRSKSCFRWIVLFLSCWAMFGS